MISYILVSKPDPFVGHTTATRHLLFYVLGVLVCHDLRGQGPQEGEFWPIILDQVGKGKLSMDETIEDE